MRSPWQARAFGFAAAAVAGALTYIAAPEWLRGTVRTVAVYDAAAIAFLVTLALTVIRDDERKTRSRAAYNDPGRNVVFVIILGSVAIGLTAAISIIGKTVPDIHNGTERAIAIILALTATIAGWTIIHTLMALRYAHLFYRDDLSPASGLVFPGTAQPDDYDFLYFAFVIGMTFQVSDVIVNETMMRRTVLLHGLISFAYNTAILALGINLISSLVH